MISRERAAQIAARRENYDWLRGQGHDPAEVARRLDLTAFVARHEEQRRAAAGLPAQPVTVPGRTITCPSCRRQQRHQCHGWCNACYRRWLRADRPAAGPPAPMPRGLARTLYRALDRAVQEGRWAA